MRRCTPMVQSLVALLCCLLCVPGGVAVATASQDRKPYEACPLGPAVVTNGSRRLALLVGVGQYKNASLAGLPGPPEDARRMYALLTGTHGYGFPPDNVCLLLDAEATTERFLQAFEHGLIGRAQAHDVVVVYYAGYGSHAPDTNYDEPDAQDETLLLYDARTSDRTDQSIHDLRDDQLHALLARLHRQTSHIIVILDTGNTGTPLREGGSTMVARYVASEEDRAEEEPESTGDGSAGWASEGLPGLVLFSAASDGTPAFETAGHGIFTDAVYHVFAKVAAQPLTYAQAARQIPALVTARSYQIPYFQGDLSAPVFGNTTRSQPVAWEVLQVGPPLTLRGPQLPGMGQGAELRIYDGAATGADTQDPGQAKATIVIETIMGEHATAMVTTVPRQAPQLTAGDLAVLARPADALRRIKVRLRPASAPGGVPEDRAKALRAVLAHRPDGTLLVEVTEDASDFELSIDSQQRLQLLGPENRIRNVYTKDADVPLNLWQHARQRTFLQLQGEGGKEFTDQHTLQVQLVPAATQDVCARGVWEQATPNTEQIIPLCHRWHVQVALVPDAPAPVLVGGVVLSTTGSIYGLPADGRTTLLRPGERVTFTGPHETFRGTPPLDIWDRVLMFGTRETNAIPWHLLTSPAPGRAAGLPLRGLSSALERYLRPAAQDTGPGPQITPETTWTLSVLPMRVEGNSRFLKPDQAAEAPIQTREFTIPNFDIRPYLPDNEHAALYKVLQKADWLTRAARTDGFSYRQHAWGKVSDAENLQLGVDCSRAIWFAFTRAGLPYNRNDSYVQTAAMIGKTSPMADQFVRCDNQEPRLGDILVYRDDRRGDGHVVLVIDAGKRIAWGSHGYDGQARELKVKPDTGVEYQLIKYKKDWERWDRPKMEQKACWRYRQFHEEALSMRSLPGSRALLHACSVEQRCGF